MVISSSIGWGPSLGSVALPFDRFSWVWFGHLRRDAGHPEAIRRIPISGFRNKAAKLRNEWAFSRAAPRRHKLFLPPYSRAGHPRNSADSDSIVAAHGSAPH